MNTVLLKEPSRQKSEVNLKFRNNIPIILCTTVEIVSNGKHRLSSTGELKL